MEVPNLQYPNPPVKEATCEFRFQQGLAPWDLSIPGLIYNGLRGSFPRRIQPNSPQQVFSFIVGNPQEQMGMAEPVDPTQSLRIWKSDSEDGVITISPNRISISHYPPYPGWEHFQAIISEAYLAYVDVAQPQTIQRIGLRYVNDIEFDSRSVILANYFTYHPNVGDALPERNQNVRMSVDFLYENNRDLARLQLSTIAGSKENSIAVRLDIDYFLLLPGTVNLGQTEEWLNRAHDAVNALFEGSITDNARAMFGRRR